MAIYKLSRYPKVLALSGGKTVSVRPMVASDAPALLQFFRSIPEDERYFLKDDVASEAVVQGWADHLDYDRALPLLAFDGDSVCADAVLIRRRSGALSHAAEIRVVVGPEYRSKGLGLALLREVSDVAWDAELECIHVEFIKEIQEDALNATRLLGGIESGVQREAVKDQHDNHHDIVYMRIPLGRWWQSSQF